MHRLGEDDAVPFYVMFEPKPFVDPCDDVQDFSLRTAELYLDPRESRDFIPIIINSQAIAERRLTREELAKVAKQAVNKVVGYVIAPRMRSINHPKYSRCFQADASKDNLSGVSLTEEGAEILGRTIDDIARKVARQAVEMRADVPDHFSGFRARMGYRIGIDGSFDIVKSVNEYFFPAQGMVEYSLAKEEIRPGLARRIRFLKSLSGIAKKSKAKELATDIVVSILADNMDERKHPARESYFQLADGAVHIDGKPRRVLTRIGKDALGGVVEKNVSCVTDELYKLAEMSEGSDYVVSFALFPEDAEMHVFKKLARDNPMVKQFMADVQSKANTAVGPKAEPSKGEQ
jgi:hypothetical protein